ncbi:MAG: hypothetical protein V7641_4050 [Blastocatellia bacterium]
MKKTFVLMLLMLPVYAYTQQALWGRPDIAVPSHDRVYAADQTSNTVSVINPFSNRLLGVIRLGDPVPGALSPLYRGELLVHGLGYSPDAKTLAVVSVGSNSVTLIDTATNKIKGKVYVGDNQIVHEGCDASPLNAFPSLTVIHSVLVNKRLFPSTPFHMKSL